MADFYKAVRNGERVPKLFRSKKRNQYKIRINDSINGINLNTSLMTCTDNLHEAKSVLRTINERLYDLKKNHDDEFHSYGLNEKRIFVKTGNRPSKDDGNSITLQSACELYLDYMKTVKKRAKKYVDGLEDTYLRRALEHFGKNFVVQDLAHKKIQAYTTKYAKQSIKSGKNIGSLPSIDTQEKYHNALKSVFEHLNTKHKFGLNLEIFAGVDFIRPKATVFEELEQWCSFEERRKQLSELGISESEENAFKNCVFSPAELDEFVEFFKAKLWNSGSVANKRFFASLIFMINTGCRRSSLARLRKRDFKLDYDEATLFRLKGRGDRQWNRHTVTYGVNPYSKYVDDFVQTTEDERACLFVEADSWQDEVNIDEDVDRKNAESLTRSFKSAVEGTKWHNAAHFHRFRHTLASLLLNAGYSQEQIKAVIGWCDDSMVKRYSHIQRRVASETIEKAFACGSITNSSCG